MNLKKSVSIVFIAILALSIVAVFPKAEAQADYVAVMPPYYESTGIDDVFQMRINISCFTTPFVGYEFKVYWKRQYINATGYSVTPPAAWTAPSFTPAHAVAFAPLYNSTHGRWFQAVTNLPTVQVTGVFTVLTLTFKTIDAPVFPSPDVIVLIDLVDTKLAAQPPAGAIPHSTHDGEVLIKSAVPPIPILRLKDPTDGDDKFNEDNNIPPGGTFNCDVTIEKLSAGYDLWGWQVRLRYNTTQLDVINVIEGPFLKVFQGAMGTYFIAKFGGMPHPDYINKTYEDVGEVLAACIFLDGHTAPSGGGVLCTITFQSNPLLFTIYPNIESSTLSLGKPRKDTKLADSAAFPPPDGIPHESRNGTYYVPYRKLGRAIDSFTDPYRKYGEKHYTQYTGLGPYMNADAYEPQDTVILYALVTYAEDPVQNKPVQFEVHAPNETLEGFPLYRTALTNASGIATISFAIPWPCVDPQRVLGKWFVYQSVEIVCEKVEDTEWFEVGWTIWLWNVTVGEAKKCTLADVTFWYKNIAIGPFYDLAVPWYKRGGCGEMIFLGFNYTQIGQDPHDAKRVFFTVVIYDDLGVPIGMNKIWLWVPTGIWCHPFWNSTTLPIHIPKWAFLGEGTAYINAYTDICSECGNPYCPEISTKFPITKQDP